MRRWLPDPCGRTKAALCCLFALPYSGFVDSVGGEPGRVVTIDRLRGFWLWRGGQPAIIESLSSIDHQIVSRSPSRDTRLSLTYISAYAY